MTLLELTVEGDPVPKGRPRVGRGRAYTPAATRNAEDAIKLLARAQLRSRQPATFPVTVEIDFYVTTRRRRDIDNMLKLVLDALNGVAYLDDDQVVAVVARKHYSNSAARTVIRVDLAAVGGAAA